MSAHTVKVTFWPGDGIQTEFTCTAPPTAECRAVWDCDCEYWAEQAETRGGKPTHIGSEKETYCVGEYNPDHCMWTDWFDGTDDPLDGEIVLPVECEFDFDHALFRVRNPLPEIDDAMIERAYESFKNPRRMLTNTSDGNIKDRLEAALQAALPHIIAQVEPRVKPSREDVARTIWDCTDLNRAVLKDCEEIADAVLALFDGKTEQEVREEVAAEIEARANTHIELADRFGGYHQGIRSALQEAARIARGGAR